VAERPARSGTDVTKASGPTTVRTRGAAGSAGNAPKVRPRLRLIRPDRPRRARDPVHDARVDLRLLTGATFFLTAAGLVMVLSAGSVSAAQGYDGNSFWYFQRQILYAICGLIAAILIARLPYRAWQALSLPLLVGSAVLMLVAAHPTSGTALYGASRWIDLGPITLQPSEFAKLALVAFSATILAKKWNKLGEIGHVLIPLAPVVLIVAALGVLQRDLGTTVILCGSVFMMLFVAGIRMRYLVATGAAGLAAAAYLIFDEAYRRTRFLDSWITPQSDPQGSGYQLIQSLVAIGSGGWTGTGLGTSRAKWDFLPNAHSDFIFAVIGEEMGLLGALAVVIAFGVLLYAGVRIAVRAPDTFGRLLAAGIVAWIGLQAIINMGTVTGLLPITGVPLPLVSFGGTALVVTLAGVGVLASVARATARPRERRQRGRGTTSRAAA
jgi:cell division protein FtsW